MSKPSALLLVDTQAQLGECALWCPLAQALYWTDIDGASLHRWRQADASVQRWPLPAPVGSFALCGQPGHLLLGLAKGVALFNLQTGRLGPPTPVEAHLPGTRINDGRCDREGRFVFGMFQAHAGGAAGGFYRVGPNLDVQRLPLPPALVANSLCFSPDGRLMYFTDSPTQVIWQLPYHADGRLGTPRPFARLGPDDGMPDGATVDAQGRLWVACWGGAAVLGLDEAGRLQHRLSLPVSQVTCLAWGGPGLKRLFVTSARKALAAPVLAREPLAGGVFVADGALWPGVQGLPESRFVHDGPGP